MSDEPRLIQRARAGDRDAFRCIVEHHKQHVYSTAYQVLGSHDDADDVTQEVFLYAYRRLEDFRGQARLSTWLYRITVNYCLQRVRRRRATSSLEAANEMAAATREPSDEASAAEALQAVSGAIDALPPRQRVVVVLHLLQGLPLEEVAGIMRIPSATARWRLHQARKSLKRELARFIE